MKNQRLDDLGVSAFCESMGMMVQAGITTDEALSLLQSEKSSTGGLLEQGLAVMKEQADAGRSLSAAMEESGIFPPHAVRMVAAGESSGRLEDILFRLSRYYADQKTFSEKIRGAVTYPAAMLGLTVAVLLVMLIWVLPAFTDVYERLTGSLAASNYRYITLAYVFCWAALVIMAALGLALLTGRVMWGSGRRAAVEKLLSRNRLCGSILETMGMFRFTSALGTFLASGEMQDEAVEKSLPMVECPPVEEKLVRCRERMEEGHSIAQAAYDEALFEPVYGRMLLAGERSGKLEQVLERLTGLLEERCSQLVDRLVGIVDPVLSGALIFSVGISLLSVMLPLIGMMNSIG